MDIEEASSSRKRRHPNASSAPPLKTSLEVLKLVETPNFEELARQYPAFLDAWKNVQQIQRQSKGKATFSSCVTQEFTVALTRALLHSYFNVRLSHLPPDHLCPPVPNRFFYLHWIQTCLLPSLNQNRVESTTEIRQTNCGLDLGVGATCIYPLLAVKAFHCNMVGTDIDTEALATAQANVQANQLQDKIQLFNVTQSHSQLPTSSPVGGPLSRALEAWNPQPQQLLQRVDFVMTNPPFYDPKEEATTKPRVGDGRARTSMTMSEGVYPGGEVGFVLDMIADSLRGDERHRVSSLWYSSMLGKKTSFVKLHKLLIHLLGPARVEVTEYGPGLYTRWFLAWTLVAQPIATAIAARVVHAKDSFTVSLQEHELPDRGGSFDTGQQGSVAMSEVVRRVVAYCDSSPGGWQLMTTTKTSASCMTVEIRESMPLAITNFVDESEPNASMPPIILDALQGQDNCHFLPAEGHFIIQVAIQLSTVNPCIIHVQLACYRHSARGLKAIEKIRNTMEAEVCRTNRRWRRILQRQKAEVESTSQLN